MSSNKVHLATEISATFALHARHDSRFGRDFSRFIPGFDGSERAAQRLSEESAYRGSRYIFVTPDNALQPFRHRALLDGKTMVMPSYGLHRGFLLLEAEAVPSGHELFASWLDGVDQFAREVSLAALRDRGPFDLVVAGTSAVTTRGQRFGMGHHYLDVEWGMFAQLHLVRTNTSVAVLVHDTQLCTAPLQPSVTDVLADLVVTPTRTLHVADVERPTALDWTLVDADLRVTSPLREMRDLP